MISRRIWLWQYALEEKRHRHAALRHLWRQALCCIGLALLGGGR